MQKKSFKKEKKIEKSLKLINQIQNINGEWPGFSNTGCLLNSYIWNNFWIFLNG